MLRYYILQDDLQSSYRGLWPAAKTGSQDALDSLALLAADHEDIYWLKKAASLHSLHAQLSLVTLVESPDKIHWLQQAAINGHGPSQFELSLLVDSSTERMRYLEQAALNQYGPAIIALSKYYFESDDTGSALRWLRKAAEVDNHSAMKLAKMLWKHGLENEAKGAFEKASTVNPLATQYLKAINLHPRKRLTSLASKSGAINQNCSQQLQFVATSIDSAVQAKAFKDKFTKDARLESLPICISPITWLDKNQLRCELVDNRKHCDLIKLARKSFIPNYTHLVFFLDEGKAYVNNGAMYLDTADTYSVFVHELAHFAGFVDEYAVSKELAKQYCFIGKAPNLAVINDEQLSDNESFQSWQRYHHELTTATLNMTAYRKNDSADTPSLAISPSRTCSALNVKSYKPSKKLTFMEYHDTRNIPPLYLLMWSDILEQTHQAHAVSALFEESAKASNKQQSAEYWSNFY
jgi:hypothetical protein